MAYAVLSRKEMLVLQGDIERARTSWRSMRASCASPSRYKDKFTYPQSWDEFENFLQDMGPRPHGLIFTRIDPFSNYSKGNCFYTHRTYAHGRRSWNRFITFEGKTQTVFSWAREMNIKPITLITRLNRGWPVRMALKKEVASKPTKPPLDKRYVCAKIKKVKPKGVGSHEVHRPD